MTEAYKNAFTEVYVILNYLDDESYFKIPKNIINIIEKNQNKDYVFYIDESLHFSEQKILEETKAILFNLYRDYLIDSEKKKMILDYQNKKMFELEKIKREKYNPNNIFKHNENSSQFFNVKEIVNNNSPIAGENENIIKKLFNKIKISF
jgi:hypothetical protein